MQGLICNIYSLIILCILSNSSCYGIFRYDLGSFSTNNRIEIELFKGDLFGDGEVKGIFKNINGHIDFSFKHPNMTKGKIQLDTNSLHFGYHKIDGDAKKASWLNTSKYPKIVFTLTKLQKPVWSNNTLEAEAFGNLAIKSTNLAIKFPIILKCFRGLRKKYDGKPGDLLFVTGELALSRGNIGMNDGKMLNVIKDGISVKIHLIGCTNKKRPLLPSKLFL